MIEIDEEYTAEAEVHGEKLKMEGTLIECVEWVENTLRGKSGWNGVCIRSKSYKPGKVKAGVT